MLHGRRCSIGYIVRQVDQELGQAAFGGCVVAENGREGGIAEGLRQTLSQSLAGPAVVTQSRMGG